jgi:hypothetical protein
MAKKRETRGRPPLPPEEKRSVMFPIKIKKAEHKWLKDEAERRKTTVAKLLMKPWRKKMQKEE